MSSGKRQRRQAAALVVQSLWSSNSSKKKAAAGGSNNKSTTNNRPVLEVPPMGFGPIRDPNCNDVLCGRGGLINGSPGNVQFRNIVSTRKKEYNAKTTKRHEKAHMAAEIVRGIRSMNPPGRFLREDANGLWFDVGDARAIRKTGQALREAAPAIREGDTATGKEDDKASDSGSDGGKKEESKESAPIEKKGNPKRKKDEAPAAKTKGKKEEATAEKPAKRPSATAKPPAPAVADAGAASTTRQGGKRNWLPSMITGSMRRNSSSNNNSDAVSVSAETVRSSQTFMIPQPALGPHAIANAPVVAMPRMSPGAVFSNSHHHRPRPPTEHPPQPYPHAPYPYPYVHHMPPPMHPHMLHHMHPAHLHPPMHHAAAVPVPMMPTRGTLPRDITEDAFGMNFFDVNMEQSECSNCTLSDISGLSSSIAPGDQRKHPAKQQQQHAKKPQPVLEGVPPLLQPPTTTSGQEQQPPLQNMEESSMLDTTSSLPSFSDVLDDVDMASATSGGAGNSSLAMASISSSSVAKMMMLPPPVPKNKRHVRGDPSLKENSNSTGSCLSGKGSEISLPSSCGTALSQFSDSFMALQLSDGHLE